MDSFDNPSTNKNKKTESDQLIDQSDQINAE